MSVFLEEVVPTLLKCVKARSKFLLRGAPRFSMTYPYLCLIWDWQRLRSFFGRNRHFTKQFVDNSGGLVEIGRIKRRIDLCRRNIQGVCGLIERQPPKAARHFTFR